MGSYPLIDPKEQVARFRGSDLGALREPQKGDIPRTDLMVDSIEREYYLKRGNIHSSASVYPKIAVNDVFDEICKRLIEFESVLPPEVCNNLTIAMGDELYHAFCASEIISFNFGSLDMTVPGTMFRIVRAKERGWFYAFVFNYDASGYVSESDGGGKSG